MSVALRLLCHTERVLRPKACAQQRPALNFEIRGNGCRVACRTVLHPTSKSNTTSRPKLSQSFRTRQQTCLTQCGWVGDVGWYGALWHQHVGTYFCTQPLLWNAPKLGRQQQALAKATCTSKCNSISGNHLELSLLPRIRDTSWACWQNCSCTLVG